MITEARIRMAVWLNLLRTINSLISSPLIWYQNVFLIHIAIGYQYLVILMSLLCGKSLIWNPQLLSWSHMWKGILKGIFRPFCFGEVGIAVFCLLWNIKSRTIQRVWCFRCCCGYLDTSYGIGSISQSFTYCWTFNTNNLSMNNYFPNQYHIIVNACSFPR